MCIARIRGVPLGVALLVGLGSYLFNPAYADPGSRGAAQLSNHKSERATTISTDAQAISDSINSLSATINATAQQSKSQEDNENGRDNLKAAQDSSKWTFWSFFTAAISTIISLAGMIYVIRTVEYTKKSLRHSETQANQAIVAATAATESVTIALDTAKKQLRAYVHMDSAQVVYNDRTGERYVSINIKNYGSTPAYDTTFIMGTVTGAWPLEIELSIPDDIQTSIDILPPTRISINVVPLAKLNEYEQKSLLVGTSAVYAHGVITYRDIYGEMHKTVFKSACHGDGVINGHMFAMTDGNEAT